MIFKSTKIFLITAFPGFKCSVICIREEIGFMVVTDTFTAGTSAVCPMTSLCRNRLLEKTSSKYIVHPYKLYLSYLFCPCVKCLVQICWSMANPLSNVE